MIICGLDLATSCGCAYGRPQEIPHVEVVRAPVTGEDYGPWAGFFMDYFEATIAKLADRLEPGEGLAVVYEAPILPQPGWNKARGKLEVKTNLATTRKLHFMGPLLEGVIYRAKLPHAIVRECSLSTIKRRLGGKGDAAKVALVQAATRAGVRLPPGEEAKDGADGFGAWLIGVDEFSPGHAAMWDARIS